MSVTVPRGFRAAGVAAGIKPDATLDLALVTSDAPAVGAGVFTINRAAAAPVRLSRKHLASGFGKQAIVINSGCANAATGAGGDAAAQAMADAAAGHAGCPPDAVFVASTGTIGTPLAVERVTAGIAVAAGLLARGEEADESAARAIMTTDRVPKQATGRMGAATVGGIAKGAGMVRPDMATMLVALTTDAVVEPDDLDRALRIAVDESFHALNIDGCPSTNDSVVVLANGASGEQVAGEELAATLSAVCRDLARQLAADAEGASRVVTLEISGATDAANARALGRTIADSALVRAAFFGGDPNWGRIVGALGAAPLPVAPERLRISFEGVMVADNGIASDFDEPALIDRLAAGDFTVEVEVGAGDGKATVLTTDLTPDYVRFNGERS